MVDVRVTPPLKDGMPPLLRGEAESLARVLPRLALEARQVSAHVALGIHGRRRAGPGETFWQFRQFMSGEPASRIDWRRSARDDRLYVREREWETASTYWIWVDLSASMNFVSSLARQAKRDRALVLGLALADLLVRGGERVGLLGLTPPVSSRNVISRFCDSLALNRFSGSDVSAGAAVPGMRDRILLLSDFIVSPQDFAATMSRLSSRGARGLAVQLRDPVETLFPFSGETEFVDTEGDTRWTVGDAASVSGAYHDRIKAHEQALRQTCATNGWRFANHGTESTAAEGLLGLAMQIQSGFAQGDR